MPHSLESGDEVKIDLRGRVVSRGIAEGKALVTREPISFLGGVDIKTGIIVERNHELRGNCITGRVLVFPGGKGSSGGTYALYEMSEIKTAPAAIINVEAETIVAVGAIIASIPLVDKLNENPLEVIETGDFVRVDAIRGLVSVDRETSS